MRKMLNVVMVAVGFAVISACTADAEPPKFPDIDSFEPVDPATYTASARAGGAAYFITPDGLQCVVPASGNPAQHVSASCVGHLPGLPAGAAVGSDGCSAVGSPTQFPTDLSPYAFQQGTGCPIMTAHLLEVGRRITKSDITCLVGTDRLTACIDPALNRGFVLQPSGSWTF